MLQCGLFRSNFSLAIRVLPAFVRASVQGAGAGSGNRTRILSLEGCCTTIVLYPPKPAGPPPQLLSSSGTRGGGSRTRTYEAITAGDLQSPPFATRDIPPARSEPHWSLLEKASASGSERRKRRS